MCLPGFGEPCHQCLACLSLPRACADSPLPHQIVIHAGGQMAQLPGLQGGGLPGYVVSFGECFF